MKYMTVGVALLIITVLFTAIPLSTQAYALPDNRMYILDGSNNPVSQLWNLLKQFYNTFIKPITDTIINSVRMGVWRILNSLWTGLSNAVGTAFNALTSPIKSISNAWSDLYSSTKNALPKSAAPLVPLIVTGIATAGVFIIIKVMQMIIPRL